MNTVTTTLAGRIDQQHPPSPSATLRTRPHVGLIDRLALRLGVALVAWSRRPRALNHRAERAHRVHEALETEQRERSAQRLMLLLLPPR